jgi:UDPglucose 6-dehydrogenase
MKVGVVGAGYVGLTVAACLAELGHDVVCAEHDDVRRARLESGECPLFESGLEALLASSLCSSRLRFVAEAAACARGAAVVVLAVGTPTGADGAPDLTAFDAAVEAVVGALPARAVLAVKSTVPVGTGDRVRAWLVRSGRADVEVVSNPEFLAEGSAVVDFMRPDRIVIGCEGGWARAVVSELYAPLISGGHPVVYTSNRSAELAKYAANAMLAARVSLMNELAALCEATGADVEHVRRVVGADHRLGAAYLAPGCGFGGSCFPKDLVALEQIGRAASVPTSMITAVREVNARQKSWLYRHLCEALGPMAGREVAVWGLAFKPGTDDVREAPSLDLVRALLQAGARVRVWDPHAESSFRALFGDAVGYASGPIEAASGADAVAICTEWPAFRATSLEELARVMRQRIMVDGRNLFEPEQARAAGFFYACVGRPVAGSALPAPEQESA